MPRWAAQQAVHTPLGRGRGLGCLSALNSATLDRARPRQAQLGHAGSRWAEGAGWGGIDLLRTSVREVVRRWLLRWRVAGGFTLPLPQIRSGATLRRSAIRICLMLIASGKSSSFAKHAHPPFQEDWGMCLRRKWPTQPFQAILF